MSYEDALDELRNRSVEPAAAEQMRQRQEAVLQNSIPRAGVLIASAATMLAALAFVGLTLRPALVEPAANSDVVRLSIATLLPATVLGWALRLVRQRKLGAQLLCRAIWWSNLVVGVLIASNFLAVADRAMGVVAALACAGALLATGRRGLDGVDPAHPFSPVRFRGHLLLALVMAFADAQTLMFSALMQLRVGMGGWTLSGTVVYAGPTIAAAVVMSVAVWGVYRLRTWALLLNLIANIAIAYLALTGVLNLALSVSVTLAATAAVQCFIPVPILAAALGDRNAGQPLFRDGGRRLIRWCIVGLAGWSVLAAAGRRSGGWLTGPGRAFERGLRLPPRRPIPTPRQRHGLEGNDLRGLQLTNADLTSAKLENADFSDSDLRFAKFSRADLRGVDFSGANLRGAVFAGANLGDVGDNDAWFEGADLTGALFSGSAVARERAQTWHPSACPDGRAPSSYEGCEGRLGAVDPEFQQAFELVSGGPRSTGCGVPGSLKRALAASSTSFLFFQRRNWVRLQDGSFMSGHARFEQSRDLGEGAWTVRTDACGTQVFREVTSAP